MNTRKTNRTNYNLLRMGVCALILTLSASSCDKEGEKQRVGKALELTDSEQQLVRQSNAAAFNLFEGVSEGLGTHDNSMFSPLSLNAALAMTANGAKGATQEGIYAALGLQDADPQLINAYFKKIMEGLPEVDPTATLHLANSIWYRRGFTVLPEFLETNRANYKASVEALDFADAGATERINGWVSQQTRTKIPTIVEQIPADMVMYLINAVYFKGIWQHQFDPRKTAKDNFIRSDEDALQTDFMQQEGNFLVHANEMADVIELGYGGGQYSMVIVRPKEGKGPSDIVAHLATMPSTWDQWMADMQASNPLNLKLPKFKFSYERTLNSDLAALGMGLAFSNQADFTGIHSGGNVQISEVKQKTFVEVNEEGTEAAAVTSVGAITTSARPMLEFVVDRPFLFAIRERASGLILFVGQVNDPSTASTKD